MELYRKLLISSRDMSSISTKAKLKRAFYLHKAGLELSTEDQELLFPEKIQSKTTKDAVIYGAKGSVSISNFEPAVEVKKTEDVPPSASLGSKLLMQFKKLSAEKGVERPQNFESEEDDDLDDIDEDEYDDEEEEEEEDEYSDEEYESEDTSEEEDEDINVASEEQAGGTFCEDQSHPVYQPIEVPIPVDPQGKVIVPDDFATQSRIFEENISRQEKLKYILQRDPQIQVCQFLTLFLRALGGSSRTSGLWDGTGNSGSDRYA